jgi:hypothetical protein
MAGRIAALKAVHIVKVANSARARASRAVPPEGWQGGGGGSHEAAAACSITMRASSTRDAI